MKRWDGLDYALAQLQLSKNGRHALRRIKQLEAENAKRRELMQAVVDTSGEGFVPINEKDVDWFNHLMNHIKAMAKHLEGKP